MTGLLKNYLGEGLLVDRPNDPSVADDTLTLWRDSETGDTTVWDRATSTWLPFGGGVEDAPEDGKAYARKDADWEEIVIPDPVVPDVTEAPEDGKQYARSDGAWEEVTHPPFPPIPEPDVEEAPNDGKQYARKNQAWAEVDIPDASPSLPPGGTDGQLLVKQSNADGDADWEGGVPNKLLMGRTIVTLGASFNYAAAVFYKVTGFEESQDSIGAFAADTFTVPDGCTYARARVRGRWQTGNLAEREILVANSNAIQPTRCLVRINATTRGSIEATGAFLPVVAGEQFGVYSWSAVTNRPLAGSVEYPAYPTQVEIEWYKEHPDNAQPGINVTVNNGGGGGEGGATAHRFWRIGCHSPTSNAICASEIQFREVAGGPNLATVPAQGIASQSPFGPASSAFDNQPNSFWGTNPYEGSWIGYDFGVGNEKTIVEFVYSARTDGNHGQVPRVFELEWSDNGTSWHLDSTYESFAGFAGNLTQTFTK